MPVLLIDRQRRRCPKAAVRLIYYCLDNRSNGIVLLGLWSSDEHVDHLRTNIDSTIGMLYESRCSASLLGKNLFPISLIIARKRRTNGAGLRYGLLTIVRRTGQCCSRKVLPIKRNSCCATLDTASHDASFS